jgi:hypothetical protein
MVDIGPERFREEAEECLRQAERAVRPLDRLSWLRMAQEWTKLAIDAGGNLVLQARPCQRPQRRLGRHPDVRRVTRVADRLVDGDGARLEVFAAKSADAWSY